MAEFTWDPAKAASNWRKHGVSFHEAATVFEDPHLHLYEDLLDWDRYIALGYSASSCLLIVVHLKIGATIRIVSARKATAHERRIYEEG